MCRELGGCRRRQRNELEIQKNKQITGDKENLKVNKKRKKNYSETKMVRGGVSRRGGGCSSSHRGLYS